MVPKLVAGHILWCNTWPLWEVMGRPAPHPAIVAKELPNDRYLLFGITHSADLCRNPVRITAENKIWAKPTGPLNPLPDVSFICVRDSTGDNAGLVVEWEGFNSSIIIPGVIPLGIRAGSVVHLGNRWKDHFLPEIRLRLK